MRREPVLISTVTAMPGDKVDELVLDLHLRAVERDARGVDQLLALAARCVASRRPCGLSRGLSLRLVARDGVLRDAQHLAVQQAVAGEVEGVDLDLGLLAGVDEADVAVRAPSPRSRAGCRPARRPAAAAPASRRRRPCAPRAAARRRRPARSAPAAWCASLGLDHVLRRGRPPSARPWRDRRTRVRRYSASACARVCVERGERRLGLAAAGSSAPASSCCCSTSVLQHLEIGRASSRVCVLEQRLADVDLLLQQRDASPRAWRSSRRWWRARPPSARCWRSSAASLALLLGGLVRAGTGAASRPASALASGRRL